MRTLIWFLSLIPVAYAAIRFSVEFHPGWLKDILSFVEGYTGGALSRYPADPIKFLTDLSGNSALWLLAASLSISPLRAYLKINLLAYRRLVGMFAFTYALIHLGLYIAFDRQFDFRSIPDEVISKPFIAFGMGAFLILLLMALTSTKKLFAKFKGWHKLVYLAVAFIAIHYLMSHKTIAPHHIVVVGTLLTILALRLMKR
ncbi:MAG: sulfite oxidase heme-binding subunit YedZ [Sulfuricurvum sp.]